MDDTRDNMPLFRNVMGIKKPNSAKDLCVKRCDVHKAVRLNELWHSRFPSIHWSNIVRNRDYCCFTAEYHDIDYASAIWSSPIAANRLKDGEFLLELRRLAISDDAPRYTATRMLSLMRKYIRKNLPHIIRLISYQDKDVHEGTIYKAGGWIVASEASGMSWTNNSRERNKEQSLATKVRWEISI